MDALTDTGRSVASSAVMSGLARVRLLSSGTWQDGASSVASSRGFNDRLTHSFDEAEDLNGSASGGESGPEEKVSDAQRFDMDLARAPRRPKGYMHHTKAALHRHKASTEQRQARKQQQDAEAKVTHTPKGLPLPSDTHRGVAHISGVGTHVARLESMRQLSTPPPAVTTPRRVVPRYLSGVDSKVPHAVLASTTRKPVARIPVGQLEIDVNVGTSTFRLKFQADDDPNDVARRFGQVHRLPEADIRALAQHLAVSVMAVLETLQSA